MNTKLTRTIGLALCLLFELPAVATAQTVTNPRAFFEAAVAQQPQTVQQWQAVLSAVEPQLWSIGIGQQRDNGGTPRGRLFLPTAICPNAAPPATDARAKFLGVRQDPACWEHAIDVVASPVPSWVWVDRGGPEYQPLERAGGDNNNSPPPTPTPTTGADASSTELLQEQIDELKALREALAVTNAKLDTQAALTVDTNAKLEQLRKDLVKATKDLIPQILKILPILGSLGR